MGGLPLRMDCRTRDEKCLFACSMAVPTTAHEPTRMEDKVEGGGLDSLGSTLLFYLLEKLKS